MLVKLKYLSQILNYSSSSSSIVLKESNILITKDGTVGRVFLLTSENLEFLKSRYSSYLVLKPSSSCPPSYLYYYLLSPHFSSWYSEIKKSFATINHLNISDLKEFPIIFSSLPIQQQKLIDFLNKKYHLIQELLPKIDLLLKKLEEYQEAFISEQVFKYSSICNSIKLKYIFRVCNGATPSTSNPIFWNGTYLFITPTDLTMDQMYLSTSSKKLTSAVFQNPSSRLMPPYSLVISCRGSIGKLNILPVEYFFSQSCEGLILLNPIDHNLKYYYYYLKIHQEYFQKIGFGSTFLAITGDTLKNFICCHLSKTQQDEIVSSLDSKMTLLTKLQSHYQSLKVHFEEYQQSLLYETFQNPL